MLSFDLFKFFVDVKFWASFDLYFCYLNFAENLMLHPFFKFVNIYENLIIEILNVNENTHFFKQNNYYKIFFS